MDFSGEGFGVITSDFITGAAGAGVIDFVGHDGKLSS